MSFSISVTIWLLSVQQMQPLVSGTISLVSVMFPPFAMREASTLISPISFTITATLYPSWLLSTLFNRVVFPAPRYPQRRVIGVFAFAISISLSFLSKEEI